jgi:hypothetical protein
MTQEADKGKNKLLLEAAALVERLVAVKGKLRENEAEFVVGMHEKFNRFGTKTYLSDKQLKWLQDLDKKHAPDPRQAALF